MQVWGIKDDKKFDVVELSYEEISRLQVDVWRVDVCDPQPIALPLPSSSLGFITGKRGGNLHLRKVRDLSFWYIDEQNNIVVAFHDGVEGVCMRGTPQQLANKVVRCLNAQPSDRSFEEHYAVYLRNYFETKSRPPCTLDAVQMLGPHLQFDPNGNQLQKTGQNSLVYVGEMFAGKTTKIELPIQISNALLIFSRWQPVVHGTALWAALRGRRPPNIDVCVAEGKLSEVETALARYKVRHSGAQTFQIDGVTYVLSEGPIKSDWSVESLRCEKPNVVSGNEIAWIDIGNGWARPVVAMTETGDTKRFQDAGLTAWAPPSLVLPSKPAPMGFKTPTGLGSPITVCAGIPGKMEKVVVASGSTIRDVLDQIGLNSSGYDVRVHGTRVDDLDELAKEGATILLLRPVRGP